MSLRFGTKAETLERLAPLVKTASVLPQARLTVGAWRRDRGETLAHLRRDEWLDRPVIVRSSALREDSDQQSFAGQFTSISCALGETAVSEAIDLVIESYQTPQDGDQIFLQPQLSNLVVSGVAFGIDPVSGGPYVVVNDQRSSHIGEVTSGIARDDELYYWMKATSLPSEPHLLAVIRLLQELETLFGTNELDVEFAWNGERLFLLQVRRLLGVTVAPRTIRDCCIEIDGIARRLAHRETAYQQVLGSGIAWGVMPDWNPAEMIGIRPRPLAAGLYRECLTDRIWAEQRCRYGYRDVTGVPLMECIGGQALVDIRASFTSFVPAAVSESLAGTLVNYYLEQLRARPELHDKVEIELVFHCWTFDLHERLSRFSATVGIEPGERDRLETALRELTFRLTDREAGPWAEDCSQMTAFADWLSCRASHKQPTTASLIQETLLKCRDEGARAFAGLARVGFVAVSLVNSLVAVGIWDDAERDRFFHGQQTVLSQMHHDRKRCSRDEFLSRYGHLRPGTYDILVPRYDEAPEFYFESGSAELLTVSEPFRLSSGQTNALRSLLLQHGIPMEPDEFMDFLSDAIRWREYGKFIYSRGISELLSMLSEYAAEFGITREECSFADQSLWDSNVSDDEFPHRLRDSIAAGHAAIESSRGLALPPLLLSLEERQSFRYPRCQPNYVTRGIACGPVRELKPLSEEGNRPIDLRGTVVMLPAADPGYDWIFTTGIVGFITKFGGANSHMAIRAREWNLPAAIGVGEVRYRRLVQARAVRVDCLHQLMVTIP